MKTLFGGARAWLVLGSLPGIVGGQVLSETGAPVAGARVYYERAQKFVATKHVGRRPPRLVIAADVMSDGKYLGQITEAVMEMRA